MNKMINIFATLLLSLQIIGPAPAPDYRNLVALEKTITAAPAVDGPGKVSPNALTELTVTGEPEQIRWTVEPDTTLYKTFEADRRLVFSLPEGDYVFILACTKSNSLYLIKHPISISPPSPDAIPQSELTKQVISWSKLVPADVRKAESKIIAANFAKFALETDLTNEDLISKTFEANQKATTNPEAWRPMFDQLETYLTSIYEKDNTVNLQSLWSQIAKGLTHASP